MVRSVNVYTMEVDRNFDEIVRMIKALQSTDVSLGYKPANWQTGDDVILPYYPFSKEVWDLSE
jgi:peroxiredoxin 2/4